MSEVHIISIEVLEQHEKNNEDTKYRESHLGMAAPQRERNSSRVANQSEMLHVKFVQNIK